MIGKQIHIFIFTDDENYLKEAEEHGHNFELSEEAKIYLLNDYKNNNNIPSNPNNLNENFEKNNQNNLEEDNENNNNNNKTKGNNSKNNNNTLENFKQIEDFDLINRNIYVPYKSILIKFYKFYDINTDMPVDLKNKNSLFNEKNKEESYNNIENTNNDFVKRLDINILKKNDKIKILKNMISRLINRQYLAEIKDSNKSKNLVEEMIISNDNYNQSLQMEKM